MRIADQPFSSRSSQKILKPSSGRLSPKEIAGDHFQSTLAERDQRQSHTSEKPRNARPQPPRSGTWGTRNLSPPPSNHPDRARSRVTHDLKPAIADNEPPTRRPAVQFDKSKPNEVPPRTTVINGIEHRARPNRPAIVVVHPHALFRDCFIRCLETSYSSYDILAFSHISEWASCANPATPPAVIVLFMDGTRASSAADLQFLDSTAANIPIVVMSDIEDANYVMRALKAGARGYIPTSLPFNVAVEAVRLVEAGGTFVPASSLEFNRNKKDAPQHSVELLTERQMMVVGALCRGMANKRIAFELNMSEHTVKVHLRHIMRKLKARNRTEVAVLTKDYFPA